MRRLYDIEIRYVSKMLEKLMGLSTLPLTMERNLSARMVGSCRDYATLFCAILRYHGVPARTRIAFSSFYFKNYYHDEVILEYWNNKKHKWCLVDPRVTDMHIKRRQLNVDFDLFDVPSDKLILAGLAWQMVRDDPGKANLFCGGNVKMNKGLWYIRDRLVQDLAALNSMEMQLWDVWGLMFDDQQIKNDIEQLSLLDRVADLTLQPDKHFNTLRHIYQTDQRFAVPAIITSFNPISKKQARVVV